MLEAKISTKMPESLWWILEVAAKLDKQNVRTGTNPRQREMKAMENTLQTVRYTVVRVGEKVT